MPIRHVLRHSIVVLLLASAPALSRQSATTATAEMNATELGATVQRLLLGDARKDFPKADVRVQVNSLDARLRFAACENFSITRHGSRQYGRVSVTARCEAPQPWAASMTGSIEVWRPVAVAARALDNNSVLRADDIAMESRNLADLRNQYISDPTRVVGWSPRRPLAVGTVLSLRQLEAPITVNKGDVVRIRSSTGTVVVNANGTALDKGMPGEQIAVRNVQSDRVVRAWVVGPGLVSTGPLDP